MDERRQLKKKEKLVDLPEGSTDIFNNTHVKRYFARKHRARRITDMAHKAGKAYSETMH